MNKEGESLPKLFLFFILLICVSFPSGEAVASNSRQDWPPPIWCILSATQVWCLAFDMIISNIHLGTKKNVQKIQVFLLLDLVIFLLTG